MFLQSGQDILQGQEPMVSFFSSVFILAIAEVSYLLSVMVVSPGVLLVNHHNGLQLLSLSRVVLNLCWLRLTL